MWVGKIASGPWATSNSARSFTMNFRGVRSPLRDGGSRAGHQPSKGIASAGCMAPEAERPLGTETHGGMAAIPQN